MIKEKNRQRILSLIDIFRRKTSYEHRLTIPEITSLLIDEGFGGANRKTIYEDIKALSEYGYDIEYANKGYYLNEAPFSLSEVKIISDSLNSLRSIDNKQLETINNKLYSFINEDDADFLKKLSLDLKHKSSNFLGRIEDSLFAIRNNLTLIVKRKNKEEEICPLFLHRTNDFYYLYYHYPQNKRIYHFRLDNISEIKISNKQDDIVITKSEIINTINASTNSFYSSKASNIKISFEDSEALRKRLEDDFPNILFTKDGASIKASFNEVLMGRLASYGTKIKISYPQEIADQYTAYLQNIINSYLPEKTEIDD